jgi:hypothetical protein
VGKPALHIPGCARSPRARRGRTPRVTGRWGRERAALQTQLFLRDGESAELRNLLRTGQITEFQFGQELREIEREKEEIRAELRRTARG